MSTYNLQQYSADIIEQVAQDIDGEFDEDKVYDMIHETIDNEVNIMYQSIREQLVYEYGITKALELYQFEFDGIPNIPQLVYAILREQVSVESIKSSYQTLIQ